MSTETNQDETASFICESEESVVTEAPAQEVDTTEEQASSEEDNTEVDANESEEGKTLEPNESEDSNEPDTSGTDTTAEKPQKKKRSAQKRIDKAIKQREEARRENEALKRENEALKRGEKEATKGKEPVESDFETYDQYLDALDSFDKQGDSNVSDSIEDNKSKETENQDSDNGLTDTQKTALAVTQERLSSIDKPDDFEAVALSPDVSITGEMLEALSECDDPAKVMYHLGKNKDIAAEIASKSPAQQMRAIAKIDLAPPSTPNKPTKLTNAPDAISPVKGSDAQEKTDSEMSFSEFEAKDNARNSKRKSSW